MLLKNVIFVEYYCYEMKLWLQEIKYLASHFCCFCGMMPRRNLEYLRILWSANRKFALCKCFYIPIIESLFRGWQKDEFDFGLKDFDKFSVAFQMFYAEIDYPKESPAVDVISTKKQNKKTQNTSILEIFVVLIKGTPNSESEEVNNIFLKKVTGKYFPFYKT